MLNRVFKGKHLMKSLILYPYSHTVKGNGIYNTYTHNYMEIYICKPIVNYIVLAVLWELNNEIIKNHNAGYIC